MSDNDKVINLFKRPNNEDNGQVQRLFKGVPYVKISKDENGNFFKEENLIDYAKKCFYIVTVMKHNGIGVALYKYKVPFESLIKFLNHLYQW